MTIPPTAGPSTPTSALTVRDLIDSPALARGVLVGGTLGLGREVVGVRMWDLASETEFACRPGDAVAVVDPVKQRRRGGALESLMRRARSAGAVALVAPADEGGAERLTTQVADRLPLPTVLLPAGFSAAELMTQLERVVHASDIGEARTLLTLIDRLSLASPSPQEVALALADAVGGVGATVTTAGVGGGSLGPFALEDVLACSDAGRLLASSDGRTATAIVQPLLVLGRDRRGCRPEAWLVLHRYDATARWLALAARATSLARGAAASALARTRLTEALATRERVRTLGEILHGPATPGPQLVAAARSVGLTLAGWHVGVHIVWGDADDDPSVPVRLAESLRECGVGLGPIVEHVEGWATWSSDREQPAPSRVREIAECVSAALASLGRCPGGVRVGVGSPRRDLPGIGRSLEQARRAALALPAHEGVAVRVVQELGAPETLLGWYASGAFRELADDIIAPLVSLEEPELLRTVAAYLDSSCSASATARMLGVHRNTVNQRVARAQAALGVTLADPDARLALQLALRAHLHATD